MHVLTPAVRRGLAEQARVVYALMLREMLTRFGTSRLGALRVFIEPMIPVLFMLAMRDVLGGLAPYGVDVALFVATGVLPFYLFRNCVTKIMDCVSANKALLFISEVKVLDAYLARMLLETAIYAVVSLAVLYFLYLIGRGDAVPHDPVGVVSGMLMAALLGSGIGLCCSALDAMIPVTRTIVNLSLRIAFIISGVLFSVTAVPLEYRRYLTWNPVMYILEHTRAAYFAVYDPVLTDGGLSYVLVITGTAWLGGLILIRRMRKWILQR
jgi:capsular polysaccharide transport system permease protein